MHKNKKMKIQIFRIQYLLSCGKQREATTFIPGKTATLIPDYAVEDLPLHRTATLVPAFVVKDLPLGRRLL